MYSISSNLILYLTDCSLQILPSLAEHTQSAALHAHRSAVSTGDGCLFSSYFMIFIMCPLVSWDVSTHKLCPSSHVKCRHKLRVHVHVHLHISTCIIHVCISTCIIQHTCICTCALYTFYVWVTYMYIHDCAYTLLKYVHIENAPGKSALYSPLLGNRMKRFTHQFVLFGSAMYFF